MKKLDEEEIQELTAANKKVSEDLEHLVVQHEQKENEIQCLTLTLTQIRNEMSRMIEKNDQEERERKTIFARQLADLVAKVPFGFVFLLIWIDFYFNKIRKEKMLYHFRLPALLCHW